MRGLQTGFLRGSLWAFFAWHLVLCSTALAGGWCQSYRAGYTDAHGAFAGGSEIMHLVAHKGKLFAANGYWMDPHWTAPPYPRKQSAQVLRLDEPHGTWVVDLDTGKANPSGLRFMKGNCLASVTFRRDASGKLLRKPQSLLFLAAGSYRGNKGLVSVWVRDDERATWHQQIVQEGARERGIRWVPRDMEVYTDKITGKEKLFLLLGNPGIISGVYDPSSPARIRWDPCVEFPPRGSLPVRPLGIAQTQEGLFFSAGSSVYRRVDGPCPTYKKVFSLPGPTNPDVGGIRGLTAVPNPAGKGASLLFMWAPHGRSQGVTKRLDPGPNSTYRASCEVRLSDLLAEKFHTNVLYVLGAYNDIPAVVDPRTGLRVRLIGFEVRLSGPKALLVQGHRFYGGGLYAVRTPRGTYSLREVNGPFRPGKVPLVAPRTFALSPFGDGTLYVGGYDANGFPSENTAWVFKVPLTGALGNSK